jgi:iron complex outermembrane receptor protein
MGITPKQVTILCCALTGAGVAHADATDAAATARIEELIVTAQRREQNMQDIGASITAISGARFQELSFRTVTDLSEQVPNLAFATPAGESTLLALSIRGIGLNDLSDSNEGPVAIYVDDVYVGILTAQAGQMYDLERIEVVRGPQGTLYGRNTTGGLVHFVTRLPGTEPDGYAEIAIGNDSRLKFEGATGGPLSDRVSGRISVLHDSDDGYQVNRTTGQSFGTKDISSVRGQLRFFASEQLDINLMAFTSSTDNRPTLYKARGLLTATGERCTDPQIVARECFDGFGYRDPVTDPHSVELFPDIIGPRQEIDNDGGSITINWHSDILTLKSITAAATVDKVDWDGAFANPIDLFQSGQLLDAEQFSQELRAGWSTPSTDFVLGLFYYTDNRSGGIPFNSPFDYDTDFDQDTDAYALFGHGEWQLSERWAISVGARYSREQKELDFLVPPSTVAGAGLAFQDKLDTDNISWNVGVNWRPADSTLLFANFAHGFKSGGWNAGGFVVIEEQIAPFDDETVDMLELGIKTDLLDNQLRINFTAFYYDYQDMQAFTQANVNGLPLSALTNVGGADIYGFEIFFSFESLTPGGEPIIEDLSGGELVLAPRLTANGILTHTSQWSGGNLVAQVDFSYSDSYFFDTDNASLDVSDSAVLWNGRLSWRFHGDKFEIALFGRNLADKQKIIEGFDIFDTQMLIYNHARVYGISALYRY